MFGDVVEISLAMADCPNMREAWLKVDIKYQAFVQKVVEMESAQGIFQLCAWVFTLMDTPINATRVFVSVEFCSLTDKSAGSNERGRGSSVRPLADMGVHLRPRITFP